jgi:purine-binding chemotaxis protein CheW
MTDDADRADRIRRMREGRRDGGNGPNAEGAGGGTDVDGDDATGTDSTPDGDEAETGAALSEEVAETIEGFETPADAEEVVDPAAETPSGAGVAETPPADTETDDAETVSVLEFVLGDERYCLDISYIEQIVEQGTTTRVPNAPEFVDGVIDLRGDITTVIDPTVTVETDTDGDGDLIVVFDSTAMEDDWSVGWAVDGVRRVSTVSLADVKDSPVDEPWINGIVKREEDGEFVIWTEPGELMRTDREERTGV